jgi:putative membrane protein
MIQYDAHVWYDHLLDIKGSMLREIIGRVALCALWAALVCLGDDILQHNNIGPLTIPETAHNMIGGVLGLLLVFRTNASYDRFWEGRKLWGSMVNDCRNTARMSRTWLAADPELVHEITEWVSAYPWAVLHRLRGTRGTLASVSLDLDPAQVAEVLASSHPPLAIARRLSELFLSAKQSNLISEMQFVAIDANLQRLIDYLGGCERIHNTPIPFAYMVHLRRALIVYCFTLPFALFEKYGWMTLLIVSIISYIMFGIEEIGVEIENPFGSDENDLPLESICETIGKNVRTNSQPS